MKGMSVFTLTMLNIATVLSIVNFPAQAEYGYAIMGCMALGAVFFFIPSALVSAELASGWPERGGMYLWVREAFGKKWGFVAVSMQWLNSLPWFASVLTFISATLAYMIAPDLASNRLFVFLVILAGMWGCTLVNLRGVGVYAVMSSLGAIMGTIVPTASIMILALFYILSGAAPAIRFSGGALLPALGSLNDWMLLAGLMVALGGIDMPAVHVLEVRDPKKNFPRAIFISSILIIVLSVTGSLSISLVVPPDTLNFASGAVEAFQKMFDVLGMPFLMPVMCVLLIWGAATTVLTWILGPTRGLLRAAEDGCVNSFWNERNKYGVPMRLLMLQAAAASAIGLVVFFMPNISSAFWLMMALSAQLYMIMYLFMFASAAYLRFSRPEVERPYRIPGGRAGITLVSGFGFLTALLALAMGFIPPQSVRNEGTLHSVLYTGFLFAGMVCAVGVPLAVYRGQLKKAQAGKTDGSGA